MDKPADIIERQKHIIKELLSDRETQARIVAGLQKRNDELARQYQRLQEDYTNINTFLQRSNPTFSSSISAEQFQQLIHRQTLDNLKMHQDQQRQDNIKREQAELIRQEKLWEESKESAPLAVQDYEQRIKRTHSERDKYLKAAEAFFNLTDEQVEEYASIKHGLRESAVQHIISKQDVTTEVITAEGEKKEKKLERQDTFVTHAV